MFGICLLFKALISSFPLSTTWVFLGLLAGREFALKIRDIGETLDQQHQQHNHLFRVLGSDLGKAFAGLLVSLIVALGIQPLITWTLI